MRDCQNVGSLSAIEVLGSSSIGAVRRESAALMHAGVYTFVWGDLLVGLGPAVARLLTHSPPVRRRHQQHHRGGRGRGPASLFSFLLHLPPPPALSISACFKRCCKCFGTPIVLARQPHQRTLRSPAEGTVCTETSTPHRAYNHLNTQASLRFPSLTGRGCRLVPAAGGLTSKISEDASRAKTSLRASTLAMSLSLLGSHAMACP